MSSNNIDLSLLNPILDKYKGQSDALIAILQDVQKTYSYLPEEALTHLSSYAKIPMSKIYAIATFYAQFYLTPRGQNTIRVCRGTACYVRGVSRVLDEVSKQIGINPGETTPDLEYNLESIACFGSCALAPVMVINERVYGKVEPDKVKKILGKD